jgi:hypothetical protein
MEALSSSETSFLIRATRRNILEDGNLQGYYTFLPGPNARQGEFGYMYIIVV